METIPFESLIFVCSVAVQILLGLALADFISGALHWLEDSYGKEEWPIIGYYVIEPNIRHHTAPLDMTHGSYLFRNRSVFAITLLVGGLFWILGWINIVTITALVFGSQANEIHGWAHLPTHKVPRFVRFIRKSHVFLSARDHWQHHRGDFDTHYCTITDFVNPVIDRLRIFRAIEKVVWAVTGNSPRDRELFILKPSK